MEVMDTVLEVIADNPPASNPEYIELPKSEKKIVKFAERSRAVLVNSSLVLAYFQFNYLLTMLLSFRKF
jgi:hypothetical protein